MVKLEWESIDSTGASIAVYRARIAHGWLVLSSWGNGEGLTFVPYIGHDDW
jgi:acyl dehydratase